MVGTTESMRAVVLQAFGGPGSVPPVVLGTEVAGVRVSDGARVAGLAEAGRGGYPQYDLCTVLPSSPSRGPSIVGPCGPPPHGSRPREHS